MIILFYFIAIINFYLSSSNFHVWNFKTDIRFANFSPKKIVLIFVKNGDEDIIQDLYSSNNDYNLDPEDALDSESHRHCNCHLTVAQDQIVRHIPSIPAADCSIFILFMLSNILSFLFIVTFKICDNMSL